MQRTARMLSRLISQARKSFSSMESTLERTTRYESRIATKEALRVKRLQLRDLLWLRNEMDRERRQG
jgi:hypothetical protein